MDQNLVIGLVITALTVIIGLFVTCATPIVKLNQSIQKLNDSIDRLNDEATKRDVQLTKINASLERHAQWLVIDKKRLDNQSRRLAKLDGEEGFIDNERRGQ